MAKRILAALMAALLLLSAAACGNKPGTADTTTPSDSTSDNTSVDSADSSADDTTTEDTSYVMYDDNLPDQDFDGAEYKIFGTDRNEKRITAAELNGERVNDAQVKAREHVEERFHVKISYDMLGDDGRGQDMFKNLASIGDTTYAVGSDRDNIMTELMLAGYLYNLSNIEQLDFTQPWYAKRTDSVAFGEHRFLGSSALSLFSLEETRIVIANKDILADRNLEMPYEKVFAGEWYLDDFIELASQCVTDLNGDGETDVYGFAVNGEFLYTWQQSLGVTFVGKDENNLPAFIDSTEKAMTYWEKMDYLRSNGIWLSTGSTTGATEFCAKQSAFSYFMICQIPGGVLSTDINYGVLPVPKLDENQKEYINSTTDAFWGVPLPNADPKIRDFIGTITEALQCANYSLVYPEYISYVMQGRLSESENDARVMQILLDSMEIDFGYSFGGVFAKLDNIIYTVKGGKVASAVESTQNTMSKLVTRRVKAVNSIAEDQKD